MPELQLVSFASDNIPYLNALLNEPAVMTALHMSPTTLETWEEAYSIWQNDRCEEVYMITSDKTPVGWMKLNGLETSGAWLSMLAIDTVHQHQGLGSRAIMLAEAMLRERGYKVLRIHTNEDNTTAQNCYKKLGYRQTERCGCTNADGNACIGYTYAKTLAPDIESIKNHWYAYAYDRLENETEDVSCMLTLLGDAPKNILEVCCGGGRILVPLARAGHNVTGFDMNEDMLAYIPAKAAGLENIRYYQADALECDWGTDFDIVVLAGNILINIETDGDYEAAQRLFIKKAAAALKPGGLAYLDFNLIAHPERLFNVTEERVVFEITDDTGVSGKSDILSGVYDQARKLAISKCKTTLTLTDGESHTFLSDSVKHIPTLHDVRTWLFGAGLTIEAEYGSYNLRSIGEDTCRAVIIARKSVSI
ncbi:MAG: bifunctional GNAT family N-acetyltransferase/class I SAM-dependent methyltransferase [Clostridiaceae bacterium]|nr:bifunctional GNAT family N-acetyltransferase/class I SAM-dependent methyltransferase [Clostridiaceae bacterium]